MLRPGTFALTALLAALTAVGPLSTDMYLPSLPDIARELSASTSEVQLTISSYLVGFACGQILYGPVSDRRGRKPVLLAAVALFTAATLACALSTSIEMLIAARTAQALGGSGAVVLARAIVRDLYSGTRAGRELSLIGSVMALAPVAAPIAGGALQTALGWRAIFAVLVIAGTAGIVAVWTLLPETLQRREAQAASSMLASYRAVAANRVWLAYLGLGTFSYAGLFAWISGASFVLQNLYGLTPLLFGFVFALASFGYLAGTGTAARLVTRFGLDGMTGCGSALLALGGLMACAAIALGLTSSLSVVIPVAVFLAGLGMVLPQAIAGAITPFPERAGAASSLVRLRAADGGGGVRRRGRGAARQDRLADGRRDGADGLHDRGAVVRDARSPPGEEVRLAHFRFVEHVAAGTACSLLPTTRLSSPATAGDPVRRALSIGCGVLDSGFARYAGAPE